MCVHTTVFRQTRAGERLVVHLYSDLNTAAHHALPKDDVPLREETVPVHDIAVTFGPQYRLRQVRLDRAIKSIGLHEVQITLHPEVEVPITINVARSADEAERQARGEDLTRPDVQLDEEELAEAAEAAGVESAEGAAEAEGEAEEKA